LPSFDFFDVVNVGEAPRSSNDDGGRPAVIFPPDEATDENSVDTTAEAVEENVVVDTSFDFLNKQSRVKRQVFGFGQNWYWMNNNNDGRTCYAALPGDTVRFRAFPCKDLLRVICQNSPSDRTPLFTRTEVDHPVRIKYDDRSAKRPLFNQVPTSVIKANPSQPLFARNGLSNPYLNYHAARVRQLRLQRRRQRRPPMRQRRPSIVTIFKGSRLRSGSTQPSSSFDDLPSPSEFLVPTP
jgi:hypothetical protein